MTVDRECYSPKGGTKDIKKVCQLVGRCDSHGGRCKEAWKGI